MAVSRLVFLGTQFKEVAGKVTVVVGEMVGVTVMVSVGVIVGVRVSVGV